MDTIITIPCVTVQSCGEDALVPATPFPPDAKRIECDGVNYYVTLFQPDGLEQQTITED